MNGRKKYRDIGADQCLSKAQGGSLRTTGGIMEYGLGFLVGYLTSLFVLSLLDHFDSWDHRRGDK